MKPSRILDGDGHVVERDRDLFEYLEAPYRNAPVLGYPFFPTLDGFQRGAFLARMGIHSTYDITPQLWLDSLDRCGIESTVLYPTAGLGSAMIQDKDWAVAVPRAYNDWFHHTFYKRSKRLRGVALLGVDSVYSPMPLRLEAWARIARDLDKSKLAAMTTTIPFNRVMDTAKDILDGKTRGRVVVEIG